VSLSTISDFERRRYHKRAQERVICYVHYKLHNDPEAYYREQLLLYYPWSVKTSEPLCLSANEDSYLLDGHETFESKYLSVQDDIARNRKQYEFNDRLNWDEIQRTAKELEEADDLLLRGGIDIDAPDGVRSADVAEQYDFGKDMGIRATMSFASFSKLPLSRMADEEFKVESCRLI
jgi:integrase